MLLSRAARSRYSVTELEQLTFSGPAPDAADLSRRWRGILEAARTVIQELPAQQIGICVLDGQGKLYQGGPEDLTQAIETGELVFHNGSIRGALPNLVGSPDSLGDLGIDR